MSYHVAIVRTKAGQVDPVSKTELEEVVASMDGRLALSRNERSDVLIYRPADGPSGEVLFWDEGELWAKNPSASFLATMIELAEKLGARVRGDEFETYRTPDDTYHHPDDFDQIKKSAAESKKRIHASRRRDWLVRGGTVGVFLLIGLIFSFFRK